MLFFIYVFLSIYPSYFFAFHWSVRDINTLLLTGRLKFQTNHRRWNQRFSCKIEGVIHIGACLQKGGKHCFSLVIYEFCSNNALYSARISFILIFLLTLLYTKILNYLKSVAFKKNIQVCFLVFSTRRNNLPSWVYFCVYPVFHWGNIVKKNVFRSRESIQKIKKGVGHKTSLYIKYYNECTKEHFGENVFTINIFFIIDFRKLVIIRARRTIN